MLFHYIFAGEFSAIYFRPCHVLFTKQSLLYFCILRCSKQRIAVTACNKKLFVCVPNRISFCAFIFANVTLRFCATISFCFASFLFILWTFEHSSAKHFMITRTDKKYCVRLIINTSQSALARHKMLLLPSIYTAVPPLLIFSFFFLFLLLFLPFFFSSFSFLQD